MKKQHVLFMSGFPRAGSTLLMNILNQNPKLYGSPTSGLIGMFLHVKDNWKNNEIFRAAGEDYVYPKVVNMMKWMIMGFYFDQIDKGLLPIDKNRMWHGHIDSLNILFDTEVKIICGEVQGVQGPVQDIITEPEYLDVTMYHHSEFIHPIKQGLT